MDGGGRHLRHLVQEMSVSTDREPNYQPNRHHPWGAGTAIAKKRQRSVHPALALRSPSESLTSVSYGGLAWIELVPTAIVPRGDWKTEPCTAWDTAGGGRCTAHRRRESREPRHVMLGRPGVVAPVKSSQASSSSLRISGVGDGSRDLPKFGEGTVLNLRTDSLPVRRIHSGHSARIFASTWVLTSILTSIPVIKTTRTLSLERSTFAYQYP